MRGEVVLQGALDHAGVNTSSPAPRERLPGPDKRQLCRVSRPEHRERAPPDKVLLGPWVDWDSDHRPVLASGSQCATHRRQIPAFEETEETPVYAAASRDGCHGECPGESDGMQRGQEDGL